MKLSLNDKSISERCSIYRHMYDDELRTRGKQVNQVEKMEDWISEFFLVVDIPDLAFVKRDLRDCEEYLEAIKKSHKPRAGESEEVKRLINNLIRLNEENNSRIKWIESLNEDDDKWINDGTQLTEGILSPVEDQRSQKDVIEGELDQHEMASTLSNSTPLKPYDPSDPRYRNTPDRTSRENDDYNRSVEILKKELDDLGFELNEQINLNRDLKLQIEIDKAKIDELVQDCNQLLGGRKDLGEISQEYDIRLRRMYAMNKDCESKVISLESRIHEKAMQIQGPTDSPDHAQNTYLSDLDGLVANVMRYEKLMVRNDKFFETWLVTARMYQNILQNLRSNNEIKIPGKHKRYSSGLEERVSSVIKMMKLVKKIVEYEERKL